MACGLILAGLLLLVVTQIDAPIERPDDSAELLELTRDIPTKQLTEDDLNDDAQTFERTVVDLPKGGWIQQSNQRGGLAQQYRFERLDPNPDGKGAGWVRLQRPEIEIYGSSGSVVRLTSDTALVYAPNNFMESGELSGNVNIRRYDVTPGTVLDPEANEPSLIVRTRAAQFDSILGDVRCAHRIEAETRTGEFIGRGLTLLVNNDTGVIERLEVATVESIRLASTTVAPGERDAPVADGSSAREDVPSTTNAETTTVAAVPITPPPRSTAAAGRSASPPEADLAPTEAPIDETIYYELRLLGNVRIVQQYRRAECDVLSVIFTPESDSLAPSLARAPRPLHPLRPPGGDRADPAPIMGPRRLEDLLTGAVFATTDPAALRIAPAPRDDDTIITCTGGLTMVPLDDGAPRPADPRDARIELTGAPVRLLDEPGKTTALCRTLRYDSLPSRVDLIGADDDPVTINAPRAHLVAAHLWTSRRDRVGGFIGAGSIRFPHGDNGTFAADVPGASDGRDDDRLLVTWHSGGELGFDPAEDDAMIGPLRSAAFIGDVVVVGDDRSDTEQPARDAVGSAAGTIECERLDLRFQPPPDQDTHATATESEIQLEHLQARGDVWVRDADRALWAQDLEVWFDEPDATTLRGRTPGAPRESRRSQTAVRRIEAKQRVAVALEDGRRVATDTMTIDAHERTARFTGDNVILIDGENVIDRARDIRIDDAREHYTMAGAGRFRRYDEPVVDLETSSFSADDVAPLAARSHALMITWADGVEITRDAADDVPNGPLDGEPVVRDGRVARFNGRVAIDTPELRMDHAETLVARFAARNDLDDGGDDQTEMVAPIPAEASSATPHVTPHVTPRDAPSETLRSIDANGAVIVRSVGDPGELRCAHLHVDLDEDDAGRSVPTKLFADGGVRVSDPEQTMWADTLDVRFQPETTRPPDATGDDDRPRVRIDEVIADTNVQVLLAHGERAFADRLTADGLQETAWLDGERILVVNDRRVLDRGTRLVLERRTGQYRVEGAGEFFELDAPVAMATDDDRVARPDVSGTRLMDAAWRDAAEYQERADGGVLTLRGAVHAESRPVATELNVIDADELALEFQPSETDGLDDDLGEATLELAAMTAAGAARLENRTWRDEQQTDAPRVYYISGDRVFYDQRTLEARVTGRGELLIRDEWDEGAAPSAEDAARFGAKGTTLLGWSEMLTMTRHDAELYRLSMDGDAQVLHRALNGERSTLTGQHIEADVQRESATAESRASADRGALQFGGPMELRRLRGQGGLLARTPMREVFCDEFDYDLATGIAEAGAAPGRTVSVLEHGATEPLTHGRILWNMRNDTITVYRGSASASP